MNKIFIIITSAVLLVMSHVTSCSAEEVNLSLSDCLNIGLASNIDIMIAKIESKITAQDVMLSEAIFDTILAGKVSYTDDQLASPTTLVGEKILTTDYEFDFSKKLPTGTEIDIEYFDERTWSDSPFATANPLHEASLSVTLTQPVLKNFFGYVDRRNVILSKIEANIADVKAKGRIEDAIADIEKAYWRLAFSYANVALQRELYKQAKGLYDIYKDHLEIGFIEDTDLYETEANMRTRKTALLISENQLITASNKLKLLLNEDGNFLIVPKENLSAIAGKVDLLQSLSQAFASNRDYRIKKKELESSKVELKMKENSLWPEVDLVGTLAVNGIARKFETATGKLTTNKFPYYYGGVEVSFPLENREARSERNKAALEKEKAVLEIIQVEKYIATTIDEKVRAVNLNHENAKRFREIKKIQHEKFKKEEEKLGYGRSTSKIVIDYQRDFMLAAIRELTTLLKYYSALIDLENEKDTLLSKVGVIG